jgi:hypothetical protein
MNTLEAFGWSHTCTVDLNVSDLAKKYVGRSPARCAILVTVRTSVDKSKSVEIWSSFQDGKLSRVSNELRHIIEDDGFPNQIRARGNIYDCRGICRRLTNPRTAAVAVRDGAVDGIGIVSNA